MSLGPHAMYDCVLNAAGAARRMGLLKQLLPFGGLPMVCVCAAAALDAGCRVLVVTGSGSDEVIRGFDRTGFGAAARLVFVKNENWQQGMLGSTQAALGLVEGPCFFVMNADMPLVPTSVYARLADRWTERGGEGLAEAALFAANRGIPGHPVLIPSSWIDDMSGLDPGGRMRDHLGSRPMELVEMGDDSVLFDIDAPDDYRRALDRLALGGP